ncbi:hypothetical protein H5410_040401 [Solanum commersonii]|uniref:Uncharacterized protein n=1 Tax=Solanum commersonii TaxID=4109 RepID=A0A9J5XQT6_SOLCO|nr:hypothetical protein H5410_040401 [Solanum commersonii]
MMIDETESSSFKGRSQLEDGMEDTEKDQEDSIYLSSEEKLRIYQPWVFSIIVKKDLSVVVQGNSSISTYFTKLKSLWDELDALNTFIACSCDCICGSKEKGVKAHQDERLLQFLMGLNETFIGVRSNILLSSPLPNIDQAYSLVIQDEKQREIHASPNYPGESTSFLVGNVGSRRFDDYKAQQGNFSKKSTMTCNYCKKVGHNIYQCYKLHGFPPNFKFTKNKRYQKGAMKMNQNARGKIDATANITCASKAKFLNSHAYLFIDNLTVSEPSSHTSDSLSTTSPRDSSISPNNPVIDDLLRKSSRITRTPEYLKDYVCNALQLTDVTPTTNTSKVNTTIIGKSVSAQVAEVADEDEEQQSKRQTPKNQDIETERTPQKFRSQINDVIDDVIKNQKINEKPQMENSKAATTVAAKILTPILPPIDLPP